MKKVFILLFVLFGFTAVTVVSCKKAEVASPVVVKTDQTATIKGKMQADLNLFTSGMENAPSGTKVIFQIEKIDLNSQAPSGEYLLYETTLNGSGEYTIDLPTNANGVSVAIMPNDFVYNQVQWDETTERTVFSAGQQNVTIVYGETEILDFNYSY